MKDSVTGYSAVQIALHWIVVLLVSYQFVAHGAIEEAWRAFARGEAPPSGGAVMTYLHIAGGGVILVLALARIYLRFTRGAPPPPVDEARILQIAAEAIHGLIYLLLFALPATGAVAWFLGVEVAAWVHGLLGNLLLAAIAIHVGGALFQHFVRRSDVVMRMFKPSER